MENFYAIKGYKNFEERRKTKESRHLTEFSKKKKKRRRWIRERKEEKEENRQRREQRRESRNEKKKKKEKKKKGEVCRERSQSVAFHRPLPWVQILFLKKEIVQRREDR